MDHVRHAQLTQDLVLMEDYANQMNAAILKCNWKMEHANNALTTKSLVLTKSNVLKLNVALEKLC